MEYFNKALKITNENFIIVLPLLAFYIILSLYMGYSMTMADTALESLIALVTVIFMGAVFCAGWFYMIKKAVDLSKKIFIMDDEAVKAHLSLIKKFPEGIGKYFLSFVLLPIVTFILVVLVCVPLFYFGAKYIGTIDFSQEQISYLTSSTTQGLINFVETMPQSQVILIAKWNLLLMAVTFVFSYLLLFWIPEIIYTKRNPVTALFTAIAKLFKKPLKSFGLYVGLAMINLIVSFVMTFTILIPILYYIMSLVSLYVFVYMLVLIFTYYDSEFGQTEED